MAGFASFDPYAFIQSRKQRERQGQPALTVPEMEAYGVGIREAELERSQRAEQLAVEQEAMGQREKALSLQERGQNIGLIASGVSTAATAPLLYQSYQKLFGEGGSPGAPTTGGPALQGGGQALTGTVYGEGTQQIGTGVAVPPLYTAGAGGVEGIEGGTLSYTAGSQGTTTATTLGAEEGIGAAGFGTMAGAGAAGAGAGWVGNKYGPGYNRDFGKIALFGQGGAKEQRVAGGVIKGAGAGAIAGTMAFPGPGTILGMIAGGMAGGASEATVICTELHQQGYITKEMLDLEKIYQPNFDWQTYWGYRIWADPIVRGMRKSPLLTWVVSLFGVAFINEVAHRVEVNRKGSALGSLLIRFGVPFCRWNLKRYARNYQRFYARFQKVMEE